MAFNFTASNAIKFKVDQNKQILRAHNACITRLLPCRLSSNLPLNAVNSKKPRMPNVANRVDAIVM